MSTNAKGLGTRCNFLTSATSGLPQVAIQIAMLAAHVATLNQSPRNPIPNKENSRGTIRDFSFAGYGSSGHTKCRVVIGYNTATFLQGQKFSLSPCKPPASPAGLLQGSLRLLQARYCGLQQAKVAACAGPLNEQYGHSSCGTHFSCSQTICMSITFEQRWIGSHCLMLV